MNPAVVTFAASKANLVSLEFLVFRVLKVRKERLVFVAWMVRRVQEVFLVGREILAVRDCLVWKDHLDKMDLPDQRD